MFLLHCQNLSASGVGKRTCVIPVLVSTGVGLYSWLNGSLFASLYAIAHFRQVLDTEHSTGRKITLVIEEMYNILTLLFGWFSIGNYYCFFVSPKQLFWPLRLIAD